MQKSERKILTTHVGSLPRNPALTDLLLRQDAGGPVDPAEFERTVAAAVDHVVRMQLEAGIDIGNDGEQPRVAFSTYVARRMRGFGGESNRPLLQDMDEFPDYAEMMRTRLRRSTRMLNAPQAIGEVVYEDLSEAERECEVMLASVARQPRRFTELFMSTASPGIISTTLMNAYYPTHEAYVMALARQMKKEYELIHSKGFILQIDCPDLAMERSFALKGETLERYLEIIAAHVEAINLATAALPPDRIRMHVCWGNYDGPHLHDIPLELILPILYKAKVGALSLEFANPRHQHEYKVFKRFPLPDSMLFLPGVIDSTTNYVEHPEVVADRILQAVEAVGDKTRVIASTDCGFGTFAGYEMVAAGVVWAKFRALREGADIATRRLWGEGRRAVRRRSTSAGRRRPPSSAGPRPR